jgi:group I intron endonuclease
MFVIKKKLIMKIELGDKSNNIGVYCIENILNGKKYIGSTKSNFRKRLINHRCILRANKHDNIFLQNAWNKYGENNFKCSIVENVNDSCLVRERENFYLNKYESFNEKYGYNILEYAFTSLGYKHSNKTIEYLSLIRKNKPQHPNTKEAIYKANKGKKQSKETIEKKITKLKGQKRKKDFCDFISRIKIGKSLKSRRKVLLLNDDYTIKEEFNTIKEASIKLNKSESYIRIKSCNQEKHCDYIMCYNYYPIKNNRSSHQYKKIIQITDSGDIKVWNNCEEFCLYYGFNKSTVRSFINLKRKKINGKKFTLKYI